MRSPSIACASVCSGIEIASSSAVTAGYLERLILVSICAGTVVASFALTEPGAGSNPAGLRTKAVRDGDDWVITGRKQYITNAPTANLFITFARTRPADTDGPGIAVFLVPADADGVEIGAKDAKMGQEGAWTSDVNFDGVRVGHDTLIGGAEDIAGAVEYLVGPGGDYITGQTLVVDGGLSL